MIRIVYMGTPDFAVPSLQAAAHFGQVVAVYTQPDRPRGRGLRSAPSAVKQAAQSLGIPVYQPTSLKRKSVIAELADLRPDFLVVAAYAQLLPPQVLDLPRHGAVNVHASLLPAYRGGAPIHWAILKGEKRTGVTTMLMDSGLDTGDILLQEGVPIGDDEDCGSLHDRLAILGAELLPRTLAGLAEGSLRPKPQPDIGVSYARNLQKNDGLIVWDRSAQEIHNQVRGLNPWPVAYTWHRGKPLRIFSSKVVASETNAEPGTVVSHGAPGLLVATGSGLLQIEEVQPPARRRMGAADYIHGYGLSVGSSFESDAKEDV